MFYFDEELQEWVDDESGEVPLPPKEGLKYRNEPPSPPSLGLGGRYTTGKLPTDFIPAERPRGLSMPSMLTPKDYGDPMAGSGPYDPETSAMITGYGKNLMLRKAGNPAEQPWLTPGGSIAPPEYVQDIEKTMGELDRGEMSETQLGEKIKANEFGGRIPPKPDPTKLSLSEYFRSQGPEIAARVKGRVEEAGRLYDSQFATTDKALLGPKERFQMEKDKADHLTRAWQDALTTEKAIVQQDWLKIRAEEEKKANPPSKTEEQLIHTMNFDPDPQKRNEAKVVYDALQKGKVELAKASGQGRATAYGDIRQITVLDTKDNNQMYTMTASDFNQKNSEEPGRYVDAAKAKSALTQTALMEDIQGAINNSRNSVKNLKNDFDETSRLLLYKAVSGQNPSGAINNFINGQFGKALSPDQIDYLTDLAQLVENAMAMRAVLGAGQGSDQLRDAIKATIPNKGTFSKEYAQSQLDKFEQQMNRLKRGVPKVKLAEPEGPIGGGTTGTQVPRKPGGWKQNANGVWYKE